MTPDGTAFLYPFIEADERDPGGLLDDLARSAAAKAADSGRLRTTTLAALEADIERAGEAMARRFERGGRLFTAGNGGSATDADALAALFSDPPHGRALPARSLVADAAVLSALGNDVGFDLVFSRQVIALAGADDMIACFSTSGSSVNVLLAVEEARRRGLLTLGLAGYDGGAMAASPCLDHLFVVPSSSVHRVQETHAAVALALWSALQRLLGATAARP
jgi:D-sedoheptulose 7-phosphate isomerase